MREVILLKTELTYLPGVVSMDYYFELPLDHLDRFAVNSFLRKTKDRIQVFARRLIAMEKRHELDTLPFLLYLQGGPGFEAPRPASFSGWLKFALNSYQVLLLDQRGTGLSSPITLQTLSSISTDPAVQAEYLKCFRADSIVHDAESIRNYFIKSQKWTVLGQSFGGFCVVSYLSHFPSSLKEAFIAGGLPPPPGEVDRIYSLLYRKVLQANEVYYSRYPDDVARIHHIVDRLQKTTTFLSNGSPLSVRRFQQLGLHLGFTGGAEQLHHLVLEAFTTNCDSKHYPHEFSLKFLETIRTLLPFEQNPLYAVLHEAIYCEGTSSCWSADRVFHQFSEFQSTTSMDEDTFHEDSVDFSRNTSPCNDDPSSFGGSSKQPSKERPFCFTGEMIFPWMFDDYTNLRPFKEVAHLLAQDSDWPTLYDWEALAQNDVPCAAVIYYDDMYVSWILSEETARKIRGLKVWITNEYVHSGIRDNGVEILSHLMSMARVQI